MTFGRAPQQAPSPSPQQAAQQTQYAAQQPQYAPYAQQPAQPQPASQGRTANPQYYQQQPAYAGQPQPAADLRGPAYDQWPQPAQDPRAYDLASYQPAAQQPQYAPQTHPGYQQQAPAADWGTHDPYAQQQHGMDPSLDPNGYGALQPQGTMQDQGYADDDLGYEQEEPPRRKSTMMIAAVLAASVVVGGGLMYAYDSLLGSSAGDGNTPVVKNAAGPTKVKPADPGGMKFDHADSKVMGRLGEGGDASAPAGDALDANGTRKVSTLKVNPDGTIQPPDVATAPAEAAPAAPAPAVTPAGIPGLSVVDVSGSRPQAGTAPAAVPSLAEAGAAAPEKPVIISKPAAPEAAPAAPAAVAKKQPAAPPAEKVEKKVAVVTPPQTAAPAAAPAGPKPTGAGFVAVLASVPATGTSQLDALRQFAELKTKYASLLADKTPEVQSANLGEKGTYHRLLAGPPGSQESVKTLCSNLKAAGYTGCWPLAY